MKRHSVFDQSTEEIFPEYFYGFLSIVDMEVWFEADEVFGNLIDVFEDTLCRYRKLNHED